MGTQSPKFVPKDQCPFVTFVTSTSLCISLNAVTTSILSAHKETRVKGSAALSLSKRAYLWPKTNHTKYLRWNCSVIRFLCTKQQLRVCNIVIISYCQDRLVYRSLGTGLERIQGTDAWDKNKKKSILQSKTLYLLSIVFILYTT